MIQMEQRPDAPTEPRIVCDTCGKPISETGIVAWSQADPWPAFYHKGDCDPDNFDFWFELHRFWELLGRNVFGRA